MVNIELSSSVSLCADFCRAHSAAADHHIFMSADPCLLIDVSAHV